MGGIKYYQLAKGEELPDEFCAVRDIDGEPSEYTFYVPETDNAKLRELVQDYHTFLALAELAQPIGHIVAAHGHPTLSIAALDERYRELGVEVDR